MYSLKITRHLFLVIAGALLAVMLLAVYTAGVPGRTFAATDTEDKPTKRTLNVTGQGTINAAPDIAYITLGVVTENENARAAQSINAEAMDKVVSLIKSAGVKSEDIKTVNYSIYPKYNYIKSTGESKIVGYTVNNSIQVTVRDMAKTGGIIDAATGSGANISNSISFGLSDYEKYYNEALKDAIAKARKRAETMAGVLGIEVKTPVNVTESGGYVPVYNYRTDYAMKTAEAASAPTPVEAGTIEVKATVSMVYEY